MTPLETLNALLCDPSGKCCIDGSDEDRRLIDEALAALAAAPAQDTEQIILTHMGTEDFPHQWYLDGPQFYCAVERDSKGVWSVFFRDSRTGQEGYAATPTQPPAQDADRKPTLKVHGWVWKYRRHEDGCSYLPSYTPEQPCKRGELFALVDPEDLHDPLNLTKRHGGEAQQGERS